MSPIPLQLSLLLNHDLIGPVLRLFVKETGLSGHGKILLLLSLILPLFHLGIVAKLLFVRLSIPSFRRNVMTSLLLHLTMLSGVLPKMFSTTSVKNPTFLLFSDLMVL